MQHRPRRGAEQSRATMWMDVWNSGGLRASVRVGAVDTSCHNVFPIEREGVRAGLRRADARARRRFRYDGPSQTTR